MPQESFTVYVIDDDASIRRALKRLLKSAGYHAATFESAEAFMNCPSTGGEGCLLLDILLPGMTGLELQDNLVARQAKVPVIFMTAHDNPQWQERAEKAGALAYLRKPFDEHALLDAVDRSRRQMERDKTG